MQNEHLTTVLDKTGPQYRVGILEYDDLDTYAKALMAIRPRNQSQEEYHRDLRNILAISGKIAVAASAALGRTTQPLLEAAVITYPVGTPERPMVEVVTRDAQTPPEVVNYLGRMVGEVLEPESKSLRRQPRLRDLMSHPEDRTGTIHKRR